MRKSSFMGTLFAIMFACLVVSLIGLIGVFTFVVRQESLRKFLLVLVSLSAGVLMGAAFLHLLPEATDELSSHIVFQIVLLSFVGFFLVEKILHWRHCHKGECSVHRTFGAMNLVGDSVHNFIDGLVIAATFVTDVNLGIATTIAVALHEIPQELGDFGVLLHAGFSRTKAIGSNFLVACTAVLGGITGYILSMRVHEVVPYLLPVAAGGFIYIAASDLMPEIRRETNRRKSFLYFATFVAGILMMFLLGIFMHE